VPGSALVHVDAADGSRLVLLSGGDPAHAGSPCWICRRPTFVDYHFVAVSLAEGHAGFLCGTCVGALAPSLAAAVQGLNLLHTAADGLDAAQVHAVGGSLDEVVIRLGNRLKTLTKE
jgi:hypothetical protein